MLAVQAKGITPRTYLEGFTLLDKKESPRKAAVIALAKVFFISHFYFSFFIFHLGL